MAEGKFWLRQPPVFLRCFEQPPARESPQRCIEPSWPPPRSELTLSSLSRKLQSQCLTDNRSRSSEELLIFNDPVLPFLEPPRFLLRVAFFQTVHDFFQMISFLLRHTALFDDFMNRTVVVDPNV